MVEHWTWDSLVLPDGIKTQLKQLQAIIEDPEAAQRFGVDPPRGLLLAGPPGTGKTTVAKVIAAQARCSFYPVSGADVMSKWVGESEGNIRRLFERARQNRPSVIFIDEIDAVAARRGEHPGPRQAGQPTPQRDRRHLRSTRRLRHRGDEPARPTGPRAAARRATVAHDILGLPDEPGRFAILRSTPRGCQQWESISQHSRATPQGIAGRPQGACQEAALAAMARSSDASVLPEDFDAALERLGPRSTLAPA